MAAGTIQVDYNLPERFDLTYKGADDKLHRPIMIHRAPFGSMERFVAVLLEHTGGKFPLWLSPQQVVVLPISEKFNDYAQQVAERLNRADIRTEVDDRNEKIGRKIRDNELKRIPYLLIVGEKEGGRRTRLGTRAGRRRQGPDADRRLPRPDRRLGPRRDRSQQTGAQVNDPPASPLPSRRRGFGLGAQRAEPPRNPPSAEGRRPLTGPMRTRSTGNYSLN